VNIKKILFFGAVAGILILTVAGCGLVSSKKQNSSGVSLYPELTPAQIELLHHNFNLTSVNGLPFPTSGQPPRIEFNQGFRVSGQVCNTFSGFGSLTDNVLLVTEMVSTRMLCADQNLNNLENLIITMLQNGVLLHQQATTLTLSRGEDVLVFSLRDWV